MTDEKVIYEKGDIKITNLRAIFGEKTYAMANITSVSKTQKEQGRGPLIGLLIGVLVLACGFIQDPKSWAVIILGIVIAGGAVYTSTQTKPEYIVAIGSSSGEIKALTSQDEPLIKELVDAVNQAIIQKG